MRGVTEPCESTLIWLALKAGIVLGTMFEPMIGVPVMDTVSPSRQTLLVKASIQTLPDGPCSTNSPGQTAVIKPVRFVCVQAAASARPGAAATAHRMTHTFCRVALMPVIIS